MAIDNLRVSVLLIEKIEINRIFNFMSRLKLRSFDKIHIYIRLYIYIYIYKI